MNPERIEEALRTADYVRLDPDARARALNVVAAALREAQAALRQIADGWDGDEFMDSADACDAFRDVARAALAVSPPADEANH